MLLKDNGFTLVEILVVLVILSIIIISIVPIMSNSIVDIIEIGIKDRAVNIAANFVEYIYQEVANSSDLKEDDWIDFAERNIYFKDKILDIEYKQYSNLDNNPEKIQLSFGKIETNGGYKVKIVFYYNNKSEKIILESFVRGS